MESRLAREYRKESSPLAVKHSSHEHWRDFSFEPQKHQQINTSWIQHFEVRSVLAGALRGITFTSCGIGMVAPRSSSIFRISKWFLKEDISSSFCYSGCDMKCQELLNEPGVAKHQTFYTEKTPKSALTPMKRAFLHGYLREICDILQR